MTDQERIEQLAAGNETVLQDIYQQHKASFQQWAAKQYGCSREDALDLFQDAVIYLYENVLSGRLSQLTSSLKTYLFAIGKNRIINHQKKQRRSLYDSDLMVTVGEIKLIAEDRIAMNEQAAYVADLLAKMGEPCEELLTLFYYKNFSMESIANRMNYKNPAVAKSQKSRCIRKLRSILQS